MRGSRGQKEKRDSSLYFEISWLAWGSRRGGRNMGLVKPSASFLAFEREREDILAHERETLLGKASYSTMQFYDLPCASNF